ncbi:phosphoenolpyruvate synthase [Pseudomonas sp. SDI]|uniref:PEP-utilizing enzyme n=1 Tax=Pseudomonas sp. SDI TaxID=2170734 RepID=UPI000DE71FC7|nr:PEP-utilizing enzyme [Pseudomonas sp. SDI]PWB35390.1 phosphoenolpyruvate synthase [Pseudomonas sp. SDI]
MALHFSTKAGTLISLQERLTSARIAPLLAFSVGDWQRGRHACFRDIRGRLGNGPWIVRSSCRREDSAQASAAGAFLSLPEVDEAELESAIDRVIASYGDVHLADEVLIQPMLGNVLRSGVAFSHDPNTCAPYRVVNWSEGSDTASVTGGMGGRLWQQAALSEVAPAPALAPVIALLDELLALFDGTPIDCEFAVTREAEGEVLWLLQARPLILSGPAQCASEQAARLETIQRKVARGMQPQPFLMGQRTVYGVMPDWNPAEIIGVRPKPLALSLYRDLVTDSIWAYQRHNYGYRNLRSFPLMPHFSGLPYIDVRLSFNSFIPADLDEGLAGRLVDHYIDRLLAEPTLHDKVEFEIVFSCYTLDLSQRLERLASAGFLEHEREAISSSLRKLTNRIVHPKEGLWRADANKLDMLRVRREALLASDADPLARIYWLLEDAKRYGTLPFAGLARAGFVAVQMLKSLVTVGVFSQADYDSFMGGISTVSGQLARDRATLDKATFLARYGHLRPGTYDILSPRYDEAPELYFDWSQRPAVPEPVKPFSLTLPQMREIVKQLEEHGLQPDPVGLLDFMQAGIELRETAKFHFTRNLSDALALIAEVGAQHGLSREDMAYCDINVFKELHVAATDPKDLLSRSIEQGKARYAQTLKLSLPPVITRPEDVWSFEWPEAAPNFITQKQVTAPVVSSEDRDKLAGAIVCIPNADPGFDWLFAYPIAGLITAWGGANSHMAIRAGELGLPAVIGAGEVLYRRWSAAKRLHLDCPGRWVELLA